MDQSHLITHTDTHSSIKKTHTFLIFNIVAMTIILLGGIGWIIYAHSAKSWPYEPYVRKAGPHGMVKMSEYIKKHQTDTAATSTSATTGNTGAATGTQQTS